MDQQKRLFLAIALSFGLTLVFTQFIWKPEADLARLDGGELTLLLDAGVPVATGEVPVLRTATATSTADAGAQALEPKVTEAPLRRIEQTRATMRVAFSTEGASIEDAVLLGKREHEQQHLTIPEGYRKLLGGSFPPPPQMDLANPPAAGAGQMAVSVVGPRPLSARARYAVTEERPGHLAFTTTQGPWQVTKTFTWDPNAQATVDDLRAERDAAGFVFNLDVQVKNVGAETTSGELVLHTTRAIDPATEQAPSMFGGIGNEATVLCRQADDLKRKRPDNDKPTQEEKGSISFVGLDQQYFLSAVWPKAGPIDGRCVLNATTTTRAAELYAPFTLGPNETLDRSYGVFLGPKDIDLLKTVGKTPGAEGGYQPNLEKTVDFGLWAFICKALLVFLRFFHVLVGNWGVAIVLLTVMVKVLLLPLTHRAMVSAEQMKKLQPKMEELRKKHADDKEKQNAELMKLYQEAKVNPLGGCLPLLLQLPIWAALFTTLRTSYELYGEPFFGVWSDLTFKDPTYLFPLLLGVTMIVTQRLQPQMMDKSQAFLMTWVMPIFFTAIMMNYPAGLSLYIFTNNLLSITQQYALRRYLERTGQAAPRSKKGNKDEKKVGVA